MAPDSTPTTNTPPTYSRTRLIIVGGVSLAISIAITQSLGRIYSEYQALNLLRGMSSALQFLGSAVFAALATVLALLLTSVSSLRHLQAERLPPHSLNLLRQAGYLAITGMALSLIILLLTIIPTAQDGVNPTTTHLDMVYYIMMALVGLLISDVMMLMLLLLDMIQTVLDSLPHDLVSAIENTPAEVTKDSPSQV